MKGVGGGKALAQSHLYKSIYLYVRTLVVSNADGQRSAVKHQARRVELSLRISVERLARLFLGLGRICVGSHRHLKEMSEGIGDSLSLSLSHALCIYTYIYIYI